jgi:kumamolisin
LLGTVTELGRILGYTPHHEASPGFLPLDVPSRGLTPNALLEAYNAKPLAAAGFTGKGATIVFFEFSGYDQKDLDMFADTSGLPRFTPVLVGGQPGPSGAETVMDLEVAHAIAPDAQKVVVNARPTVEGDGAYEKIGQLFESVDRQFPGAVWSLSIGWGCDALVSAADLAPVRPRWPPRKSTERRRSTRAGTPQAWSARAATIGRLRRDRTISASTPFRRFRR